SAVYHAYRVIYFFGGPPAAAPREVSRRKAQHVRLAHDCYICDWPFETDEIRYIDHIYPCSKGGSSELYNLAAACFACNSSKSNKTYGWKYPPRTKKDRIDYIDDLRTGVLRDRGWVVD